MRLPALVAMSALLGGCVSPIPEHTQPMVLDELLAFSDQCHPEPAFAQLLESLVTVSAKGHARTGRPKVPAAFRRAFGQVRVARPPAEGQDLWQVEVDVAGRWRGLRITRVVREIVPQSGVQGFQLHFTDPPETVAEVLRRLGIAVRIGESIDISKDGMSIYAALLPDGSGSLFDCGT